jgi:hypothetical protein
MMSVRELMMWLGGRIAGEVYHGRKRWGRGASEPSYLTASLLHIFVSSFARSMELENG